eukprot:TRINITY_DN17568_c0_g3_i1.p1 TRINITY_DN17568_c0_g3~~TRINITY_DN17568_c0_g3_i1.p1  ORF type:complete len:534 (+),score=68.89 TRINITY_DN17568_c0_g3_i1:74-1603(+)
MQGIVNLANVPFSTLIGRSLKTEFSDEAFVFALAHGDVVVKVSPCDSIWGSGDAESARRVRVWEPRLNRTAWVWEASTDGTAMIDWYSCDPNTPKLVRVIAVETTTIPDRGLVSRLLHYRERTFRKDDVLVQCSTLSPGVVQVRVPGESSTPSTLKAEDVDTVAAPLEVFIEYRKNILPDALLRRVKDAFDVFAAEGDNVCPGCETSVLFSRTEQQRDSFWRDLIDPELCLVAPTDGVENGNDELDWQTADIDVDERGSVKWMSWVNHLDTERHGVLLGVLAELLQMALPQLQSVSGQRLQSRRLQVVVRAYQHEMAATDESSFYRVTDWHTDGHPRERIIATAACYVEMASDLKGGAVEFASGADTWLDDPEVTKTVQPEMNSILAFNNAMLRHRVGHLCGVGRRRLVAFHVVDPEHSQSPPAAQLPRQLRSHRRREMFCALAPMRFPSRLIALMAEFAATGATPRDLLRLRDEERSRRLRPKRRHKNEVFRRTTTIYYARDDSSDES